MSEQQIIGAREMRAEIARLTEALAVAEKRIAELEAALRPFAESTYAGSHWQGHKGDQRICSGVTLADFRRAKDARSPPTEPRRVCIVTDALCSRHCTDRCARVPNAKAGEWE